MKKTAGGALLVLAVAFAIFAAPPVLLAAEPEAEQARIAAITRPAQDFSKPERYERRPAGKATVFKPLTWSRWSPCGAPMKDCASCRDRPPSCAR